MKQVSSHVPVLDRARRVAAAAGALGVVLGIVGAIVSTDEFLQGYLTAYLYWFGVAIGSLSVLMLYHLVGGRWGATIQRPLEAAAGTLPLLALLFVPVMLGVRRLYWWAAPLGAHPERYHVHVAPYLNVRFFVWRSVGYLVLSSALALLLGRWSRQLDRTAERRYLSRQQLLSGPGLILVCLIVTFSSIDWAMSLEHRFASTIFGLLVWVGDGLSAFCVTVIAASALAARRPFSMRVSGEEFHDLGNLVLTFVILWAYHQFSQFLIIWAGNLPDEVRWYVPRGQTSWVSLAIVLALFHFAVPFLVLLLRNLKFRRRAVAALCLFILAMRCIDLFWMIQPSFHPAGIHVHWQDFVTFFGLGGIWIAAFVSLLSARPSLAGTYAGGEEVLEAHA